MRKKTVITGLVIMVAFQAMVLTGEYLGAVYPLWTGREVRLKVVPVDPRSMFRGNYARLRYGISTIEKDALDARKTRVGEVVYVKLKPGMDGVYEFDGASLDKPEKGIYLKGRVRSPSWSNTYDVLYGLEAYFAPKEKALALEKELRRGGLAIVMVAGNGKAALKDVVAKR